MHRIYGNLKYILAILIVILFTCNSLNHAQMSFSVSTEQEYNDNPFHSPIANKSMISTANIGTELDANTFAIGYYGSYVGFSSIPERNFYWHQVAAWKEFDNSTVGIYAEQRINTTDYSYLNYSNLNAFYSYRFSVADFYISLTPNLSLTNYKDISILNNYKATLSYFINRGFETGTTFILGGGFNFKKYLEPSQSGTYSYFDESNTLVTESYTDENVSSLSQVVTYGRIAQSITSTTGLAVQFTNRSIINGIASQVKELNTVYGDESEIFDDPVNNEGNSVAVELTQILLGDMTIKVGYYLNKKFYPSQGLYDIEGNYDTGIMRTDTQSILNLSVNKKFELGSSSDTSLKLGMNYQYISNNSNSYWFNYKGNSINVSLGLEF